MPDLLAHGGVQGGDSWAEDQVIVVLSLVVFVAEVQHFEERKLSRVQRAN